MTRLPPLDRKLISLLWAGPERAADIAGMHTRLFDAPWNEPSVATLLEHPASTAFIAEIGLPKIPVGFIMGQLMADEAEILSLGVAPELQRRGIGRALVDGLLRAAKRAECKRLFLEVAADNVAALALYRRLGFADVRRREGYYPRISGPAVDALVLQFTIQVDTATRAKG